MQIGEFGNRHYFASNGRNGVRRNLAFWRVLDDVPIVISWRLCRQIGAIADGEMEIIARTACQIWTIPSPAAHGAHRSQDKHQAESPQPAHCKFRAILQPPHPTIPYPDLSKILSQPRRSSSIHRHLGVQRVIVNFAQSYWPLTAPVRPVPNGSAPRNPRNHLEFCATSCRSPAPFGSQSHGAPL